MSETVIQFPLPDAAARKRIREDLDATLLVEAAAGTGKTSELVARIVALLRTGRAELKGVLAVTFTDKAAGEMKLRLRGELERAQQGAPAEERERFTEALRQLEAAPIGTIHSVCTELLRERPVEAGVDPLFEVAADDEADRLYGEAFEEWFAAALADQPEGVRRILRRRVRGRDAEGARELLRNAGWQLCEHRDFDGPFRREPFARGVAIEALVDELRGLASLARRAQRPDDWLAKSLAELQRFFDDVERREQLRGRDEDGLEAELRELARHKLFNWKGSGKNFCEGVPRQAALDRREAFKANLDAFVRASERDLAALLREELRPLVAAYEDKKSRAGCLDFLDLLARAGDLVRRDARVLDELRRRYSHVLVDEFQDTDPLQAELLLAIAGERPGALFAVGDPKQSIYRFRRADLGFYDSVKARLLASGAELIFLSTSFRSAPAVQAAINAAFEREMQGQRGQAGYVPLHRYRPARDGQPGVVALPAPAIHAPRGNGAMVAKWVIEKSYPDAVGAFVDWLCSQSGWKVADRNGSDRPVEPRDVCLLFKRLQSFGDDITRPYVEALEARGLRHVLVSGKSYHAREEVLALRNAAQAIEWPDDELAVFATLRGPLFALQDDQLLAFRHAARNAPGHGKLHPLRDHSALPLEPSVREVADALAVLGELHRLRNRRPIADTLARLLRATRAHAALAIWPNGEQALANALRVLDLARRFESGGAATSFRAFVERLMADEQRGETGEAAAVEEGAEGVRIMSVHRAKGLEFPVVVLCDPTAPAAPRRPSRWVDQERRLWAMPLADCTPAELDENRDEVLQRDRFETVRLAYVAATRARDLLVVPFVADEPIDSWLQALLPAVTPSGESRRQPGRGPGCPEFTSRDVVLERPDDFRLGGPVAPGLHRAEAGNEVVVWDPRALELHKEAEAGLRREALLEQDAGGMAEKSQLDHDQWIGKRANTLAEGLRPSLAIVTPTERAAAIERGLAPAPAAARRVRHEAVAEREPGRPGGKRFGALVHALLAAADPGAPPAAAALRARADCEARLLGATDAEAAAATVAVSRALAHPLLRRAAASDDCRREAGLWLTDPSGALIEGSCDLAFREAGRWLVIDFKTDEHPEAHAGYAAQLALYCDAITAATGDPSEGVLLAV